MFNCGPVFQANQQATEDIIINQGGTDSGKTYALIQLLFTIALFTKPHPEDPIITIVGESVPNLKKGAYRVAQIIYNKTPYLQSQVKDWNQGDRTFKFFNGWIMEFNSYVTEQQAKQGKRQYLFVNEAQSIPWPIFWQLAKKTRIRTFIDYNPTAPFWAHDNLIGTKPEGNDLNAKVKLIISDHRHNPFLSEADHAKTENIKDRERWLVYARGKTGNLEGIIYTNWQQIKDEDFPDADFFGGLDFGYTSDPTAGVKLAVIGNNLYVKELCYETGLPAMRIKEIFKSHGFTDQQVIYCEHDKEQIAQLRFLGLTAIPANKASGSLKGGILKVKEYNVFYTVSSKNIHEERKRYMWEIDPNTGKPTNAPKPGMDHCFAGSTLIHTNSGTKRINNIKKGDLILTSKGFKKCLIKWNNGFKETSEYTMQCDTHLVSLQCTPNHLIKTNLGWIEISKLKSGMTVYLTKPLMGNCINFIKGNDIFQEVDIECTSRYINTLTEMLKKAITFIIKMKIDLITAMKTLKSYWELNIVQTTAKRDLEIIPNLRKRFMKKVFKRPRLGINPKKELNGINNGLLKQDSVIERMDNMRVKYAPVNLQNEHHNKGFVQINANLNSEEQVRLMKLQENAHIVGSGLKPTSIQRSSFAEEFVVESISVREMGMQRVFDLTIEGEHEYFANGLLVHNCLDAVRYGLYTKFFRQGL